MGTVWGQLRRIAGSYNIEARTQKLLKKSEMKPVSAPRHKREKKYIENMLHNKEIKKAIQMKDCQLDDLLRNVRVTSHEPELQIKDPEVRPRRRLPTKENEYSAWDYKEPEFGFHEVDPQKVPAGKLTFREAPFARVGTGSYEWSRDARLLDDARAEAGNFGDEQLERVENLRALKHLQAIESEEDRREKAALVEAEEIKMQLRLEREEEQRRLETEEQRRLETEEQRRLETEEQRTTAALKQKQTDS